MKKLFTFVSALALSVFAFASTTVEMNFSDPAPYGFDTPAQGTYTQVNSGDTISKDNVDLLVNFPAGKNGFRFYSNSNTGQISLRGYVGAEMKIAAPAGKKLLKIKVSGSNLNTTYLDGTAESKDTLVSSAWEGEKDTVYVSIKKSTVYFDAMTITYGDPGETPEVVKLDTIGVKAARERIDKNQKGACYIKGVVAGDPFELGTNGPAFYMTDIESPTDSLEAFKIYKDAKTPYANVDSMSKDIAMGDTVLIYADGLDLYKGKTYETTGGNFCETLGKSSATVLDWKDGKGKYAESDSTWTLTIEKDETKENFMSLVFKSDKQDTIAGFHNLVAGSVITYNKQEVEITSGSITLTFNKIGTNGYNLYKAVATIVAGDKMFRLQTDELEVFVKGNFLLGDRPFIPAEGDTLTCAQAREYVLSLEKKTDGMEITVRGYVTDIINTEKIYNTFWMDDQKGTGKTFEVAFYSQLLPAGMEITAGTEVIATGIAYNYDGTPEIKNGVVTIIEGGQKAEEITVAKAVEIATALENNKNSDKVYSIIGYITSIKKEFSADAPEKGKSFWMNDEQGDGSEIFQAYAVSCDAELAAKLVPGAKVKVTAKITHYYSPADDKHPEELHVYETVGSGAVEILEEAAVEPVTQRTGFPSDISIGFII